MIAQNRLSPATEFGTTFVATGDSFGALPVRPGSPFTGQVGMVPITSGGNVPGTRLQGVGFGHVHPKTGTPLQREGRIVGRADGSKSSERDKNMTEPAKVPSFIFDGTKELFKYDPILGKDVLLMDGKDLADYLSRAQEAYSRQQQQKASAPPQ